MKRTTKSKGEDEMRNRNLLFSLALVMASGLLTAPAAMAADPPPPSSCTTTNGYYVEAIGPTVVDCGTNKCTQILYTVSGGDNSPDHVAVMLRGEAGEPSEIFPASATYNISSLSPTACGGDSVVGIASNVICHERIVRINNQPAKYGPVGFTVEGSRGAMTTSLIVKKGKSNLGSCAIVGIGLESQIAPVTEVLEHEGCSVAFTLDRVSGTVLKAELTTGSDPGCALLVDDVSNLEIKLGGLSLGNARFGDGYVHSGSDSCTTRIIGGKVYTWGSPCP